MSYVSVFILIKNYKKPEFIAACVYRTNLGYLRQERLHRFFGRLQLFLMLHF